MNYLLLCKNVKNMLPSFLVLPHLSLHRWKLEKYVMIGKEMCQSAGFTWNCRANRRRRGNSCRIIKYVIKFVINFPPPRIYISSEPYFRSGANRIMMMLWQEAITANTRRSQLNFIYYSSIFISSYTCIPLIFSLPAVAATTDRKITLSSENKINF